MAVCSVVFRIAATSQLNSEIRTWDDLWPEVTEALVVEGNLQRIWGGCPEATFSLCHLLGDPRQLTFPPWAPVTKSAMRGS